jgi:hypothetical protein
METHSQDGTGKRKPERVSFKLIQSNRKRNVYTDCGWSHGSCIAGRV